MSESNSKFNKMIARLMSNFNSEQITPPMIDEAQEVRSIKKFIINKLSYAEFEHILNSVKMRRVTDQKTPLSKMLWNQYYAYMESEKS